MNKPKREIPAELHKKLSEAGKRGNAMLSREQKALGGRRSWERRLKKALETQKDKNNE